MIPLTCDIKKICDFRFLPSIHVGFYSFYSFKFQRRAVPIRPMDARSLFSNHWTNPVEIAWTSNTSPPVRHMQRSRIPSPMVPVGSRVASHFTRLWRRQGDVTAALDFLESGHEKCRFARAMHSIRLD